MIFVFLSFIFSIYSQNECQKAEKSKYSFFFASEIGS